jgi:DNA-binding XRE family transcriptional regulator
MNTGSNEVEAETVETPEFTKVYAFEPNPGELGMGPDELEAIGEISGDPVPSGVFHELLVLMGKLRARREMMGLSLSDVSERSGLTRPVISKLENGHTFNPTIGTLYRYAMALDAGVTFGLEEIGPDDQPDRKEDF